MKNGSNEDFDRLYQAVLTLKNLEECRDFFDDLFTISEIEAAAQRMKVADMLFNHVTCSAISESTGISTATVSRVNKYFKHGSGAYRRVLERLHGTQEKNS